jgi:ABC-type enterochelin transport system permease subunit
MATRRRQRFIVGTLAWQLGTVLVLALLGSVSLELVFVVSLIGLLVVTELTAPFAVTPEWRRRLIWIIAAGLLVFGYIVIRRILEILPPGVL